MLTYVVQVSYGAMGFVAREKSRVNFHSKSGSPGHFHSQVCFTICVVTFPAIALD